MRIGITSAVFDLFHRDHKKFIDKCLSECEYLRVYLDSDDFVMFQKNRFPKMTFSERKQAILDYGVHEVIEVHSWEDIIQKVRYDEYTILFLGSDQQNYLWKDDIKSLNIQPKMRIFQTGEIHTSDILQISLQSPILPPDKFDQLKTEAQEYQQKAMSIFIYFRDIAINNSLQYILCEGSLLGCIRHQGFIPWDDDMDLYMEESELMKLVNLISRRYYIVLALENVFTFRKLYFFYDSLTKTKIDIFCDSPRYIFDTIVEKKFEGIDVPVPGNYIDLLDVIYKGTWQDIAYIMNHSWGSRKLELGIRKNIQYPAIPVKLLDDEKFIRDKYEFNLVHHKRNRGVQFILLCVKFGGLSYDIISRRMKTRRSKKIDLG